MNEDLIEVGFKSPVDSHLPVEVVEYGDLLERMGPDHQSVAQRPTFGVFVVAQSGVGVHTVDFDQLELVERRAVFVRPGQVQQWGRAGTVSGHVVIARAELCRVSEWFPGGPQAVDLDIDSVASVSDLLSVLEREQARFSTVGPSVRLLGSAFSCLLDVFERASPSARMAGLPDAYVAYRRAIETGLGNSRDARTYIRNLGYSERTVSRACQQVTGRTAKGVLDNRLMLEARRLLAHTDSPIGEVGQQLGFAEASNFNKFFSRHAGVLPAQFRSDLRATGWAAETVT